MKAGRRRRRERAGTIAGLTLVATVGVGAIAFLVGDPDRRGSDGATSEVASAGLPEVDDPVVATRTADRLRLFRTGNLGERIALTGPEITAMLRHAVPGVIPVGVLDPVVEIVDGTVTVAARLTQSSFPGTPLLTAALGVLPDTFDVELEGRLAREGTRLVLRIDRATAERVPLPLGVVASIASSLGDVTAETVAEASGAPVLWIAWPRGIGSLEVAGNRVFLDRVERIDERAVDGSDGL